MTSQGRERLRTSSGRANEPIHHVWFYLRGVSYMLLGTGHPYTVPLEKGGGGTGSSAWHRLHGDHFKPSDARLITGERLEPCGEAGTFAGLLYAQDFILQGSIEPGPSRVLRALNST